MGQPSSSGIIRPMWFVMLLQIVLVFLRCSRLVKVVGNSFALLQDDLGGSGLFYDDSSSLLFVEVFLGVFCGFLGCSLF